MTPEAALKPARRKTQKKRLRIPLPPGSLKLMSLPKKTTAVNQVCKIITFLDLLTQSDKNSGTRVK